MPAGELVDVALWVLRADLVVGTDQSALQECPEALDTVRVGLVADVLADAMADGLVPHPRHPAIRPMVICVDGRPADRPLHDERLQLSPAGVRHHPR